MMIHLLFPILMSLLCAFIPLSGEAADLRTIEVDYSFSPPETPGVTHTGYRLYQNGQKTCETNDTTASPIICEIMTDSGTFEFTLTALYSDNTESPPSPSMTLDIPALQPSGKTRTLEVEYDFSAPTAPGVTHVGYRLYKDGQQACEIVSTSTPLSCDIVTEAGTFDFTLTAWYSDNTESPHSPPYALSITDTTTTPGTQTTPELLKAAIAASSLSGAMPLYVAFDGSGSSGDITAYNWNFGDGSLGSGAMVDHAYTAPGNFTATLVVKDSSGSTDQSTVVITVEETAPPSTEPPTAVISSSTAIGEAPLSVSFDGSGSSTNQPPIVSYDWAFGDGKTATGETSAYTFSVPGTFSTTLTVTDNASISGQASIPVLVTESTTPNEPPKAVISISSLEGEVPFTISYDGSGSTDPEGPIASYVWNFGDGSIASGATGQHTFTTPGSYVVVLEVTDSDGENANTSTTISAVESLQPEFYFELEEVQVGQAWKRVDFAQPYSNPIVVAGPPTFNDAKPVTIRVRNIDSNGFEIRLEQWSYLKGRHKDETVTYMVMEKGSYSLANGTKIEAGTFIANSAYGAVTFAQTFSRTPVVFTQVLTVNDPEPVTGRLRTVVLSGFEYQLQEQETTISGHQQETTGYIAWESGSGSLPENQLMYEAGITSDPITNTWATIKYQSKFPVIPFFISDIQTSNEIDTATLRIKNASEISVLIKVEEEQSKDQELNHASEKIGYLVIGSTSP